MLAYTAQFVLLCSTKPGLSSVLAKYTPSIHLEAPLFINSKLPILSKLQSACL
jgi:hypothetical protein